MMEYLEKLLVLTKNRTFISTLKKEYSLIEVENIEEILQVIKDQTPRLVILDFKIFNNSKSYMYKILNLNPALNYIPVVLVLEDDSIPNRNRAFSHSMVSGILSYNKDSEPLKKISTILENSIPYAGTLKHTALTAIIDYEKHIEHSNSVSALALYLCKYEGLKNNDLYDTLFALNLILIKNKIGKILHYLKSFLDPEDSVIRLLENFNEPKNIQGKIIIASLLVDELLHPIVKSVELDNIEIELINRAKDAYKKKKAYIYDRRRLNSFIDQATGVLFSQHDISLDTLDQLIKLLVNVLERALAIRGGANAEILIIDEKEVSFFITPFDCTEEQLRKCISETNTKKSEITILYSSIGDLASVELTINKEAKNVPIEDSKVIDTKTENELSSEKTFENELLHSTLHRGSHFENAKKYIEDLGGLDSISSAIYELEDVKELLDISLSKVFDNAEDLKKLSQLLTNYGLIIHNNFYEFEAIAIGLRNLADTLEEKSKDVQSDFDYNHIQHLIELLISDLDNWYETIFINQNVDHIHYLDSSLLSSCIQMQSQISNTNAEEEDDNDLELF